MASEGFTFRTVASDSGSAVLRELSCPGTNASTPAHRGLVGVIRYGVTNPAAHIRDALPTRFSQLAVFEARLYIEYAASMSLLGAAAFAAVPGLNFTRRMNLPAPCSKRAGFGSAAL
jgi:hypothetical protein